MDRVVRGIVQDDLFGRLLVAVEETCRRGFRGDMVFASPDFRIANALKEADRALPRNRFELGCDRQPFEKPDRDEAAGVVAVFELQPAREDLPDKTRIARIRDSLVNSIRLSRRSTSRNSTRPPSRQGAAIKIYVNSLPPQPLNVAVSRLRFRLRFVIAKPNKRKSNSYQAPPAQFSNPPMIPSGLFS